MTLHLGHIDRMELHLVHIAAVRTFDIEVYWVVSAEALHLYETTPGSYSGELIHLMLGRCDER